MYAVDLAEAERSSPDDYASFNDFFTRALKPGCRPIEGDARTVVAPADGALSQFGRIEDGRLLQAKGVSYELAALVGEDGESVARLRGGSFLTVYLAPRDYHRVHLPIDAVLTRTRYIPGARYSVSLATAAAIEGLFCRNERAVCWFDSAHGPLAVVLVGALNVSSISTFSLGEIPSGTALEWAEPTPRPVARGAEIARFNLGSTVVLLFARDALDWDASLTVGRALKVGAAVGRLRGRPPERP